MRELIDSIYSTVIVVATTLFFGKYEANQLYVISLFNSFDIHTYHESYMCYLTSPPSLFSPIPLFSISFLLPSYTYICIYILV